VVEILLLNQIRHVRRLHFGIVVLLISFESLINLLGLSLFFNFFVLLRIANGKKIKKQRIVA